MTIEFQGEIIIAKFQSNSGEESPWSIRIRKQDNFAVIKMYWADKETSTHVAFADLEKFKQMVASL